MQASIPEPRSRSIEKCVVNCRVMRREGRSMTDSMHSIPSFAVGSVANQARSREPGAESCPVRDSLVQGIDRERGTWEWARQTGTHMWDLMHCLRDCLAGLTEPSLEKRNAWESSVCPIWTELGMSTVIIIISVMDGSWKLRRKRIKVRKAVGRGE